MVNDMREQYIKFVDEDVDGCGTDIISIAKVYGSEITIGTVDRIFNKWLDENWREE